VRSKWMISESIRRWGISVSEVSYKGHRYPAEIIAHCVWPYHRFPLSFREVEELMLVRGVIVSYETIRQWCAKFGPEYACRLRRRPPPTRRQVASRRGVLDDHRPSAVSVAGIVKLFENACGAGDVSGFGGGM